MSYIPKDLTVPDAPMWVRAIFLRRGVTVYPQAQKLAELASIFGVHTLEDLAIHCQKSGQDLHRDNLEAWYMGKRLEQGKFTIFSPPFLPLAHPLTEDQLITQLRSAL